MIKVLMVWGLPFVLPSSLNVGKSQLLSQHVQWSPYLETQGPNLKEALPLESPQDSRLPAGGEENTTWLRQGSSGKLITYLTSHRGLIESVVFSPDGSLLAAGLSNGSVIIWRLSDGKLTRTFEGNVYGYRVLGSPISFSPDGTYLASRSREGIRIWRVSDGSFTKVIKCLDSSHVSIFALAFSPDGKLLASITGFTVHSYPGGTSGATKIQLHRMSDGGGIRTLGEYDHLLCGISFSPDGKLVATGSQTGTIKVLRVSDGKPIFEHQGARVGSVAFSPDGDLLVSGDCENTGTVKVWRMSDGRLMRILPDHKGFVTSLAFNPEGSLLASHSYDIIKLWGVSDGRHLRTLKTGEGCRFLCICFSKRGSLLASGDSKGNIKLWRVSDGSVIKILKGHEKFVR